MKACWVGKQADLNGGRECLCPGCETSRVLRGVENEVPGMVVGNMVGVGSHSIQSYDQRSEE